MGHGDRLSIYWDKGLYSESDSESGNEKDWTKVENKRKKRELRGRVVELNKEGEILKVSVEGGESVFVPLTPVTTFKDVSACVREPGDPLPLILEESPLGARVVPGWERPLELLRLWGDFREQVNYNASFSLSRHLKDESYLNEDSKLKKARSRTPDATTMKYGNIDPWELYELRDDLKDLLLHDLSFLNESSSQSESNDAWELRDFNNTDKYQRPFGGESDTDIFNTGFVSKSTYSKINNNSSFSQNSSPESHHSSSILESNKENEGSITRDTDESHLLWTSFNSHTKDKRYRKRIRKSHMTEEEQNNHLQNLLQESRLASVYGSPFRRGSIQTCSFPNNSAKHYDLKRLNGKNQGHRRFISYSGLYTNEREEANSQNENERNNFSNASEQKHSVNKNLILKECDNQGSPYNRNKLSNGLPENGNNEQNSAVIVTNIPFKRISKNPCRSPDCHSGTLSPIQTNRKSLTSDAKSTLVQQSNIPISSKESMQTEFEAAQRDSSLTSIAKVSLPPYIMSPHYLSQLRTQVIPKPAPLFPPYSKVQPSDGQQLYRNAESHSSLRHTMSSNDTTQLQTSQNQFGNPENISRKKSNNLKQSPSLSNAPVKKELPPSEQTTTSSSFRFFNKFPSKSTKEVDKIPPRQEINGSESQIFFKPSHNLEASVQKLQKPLSPKLKLKTMSPKQLKKGKKKVEELARDTKVQPQEVYGSQNNNKVVPKTQNKFFFQNKTNHSNKIEPSSRNDKQELISNKSLSENSEHGEKCSSNLIRKSILRNTLFSSGTSSSSTTSSSLSTLGSESKSYKKYLSSFHEKSNNQQKIVPASREVLKRHNSIPTICKPNLKSNLRPAVHVTSSSSDLLDSSSDNDEDELSLSLAHRQHKLLSHKERAKLAPKSSMHIENLQNKNSAKNLLFRKMVKDIPPVSNKVPDYNNDRIILTNSSRLSQRKSRSKHRNIECDHVRSYSDPLYEYLEENRKMERRRRHSGGAIPASNEGMKDSQSHLQLIPESGDLTVNELREMATRQQQHIESQQQLLVAREQRLKYLKQQEGRTSQVNMETERLRRLRERVEAQEAKLRRLRALRGQVDNSRLNAASLYSDLDAMRHLFSEKEKELVDAAAKVEELTRQLEDVRGGRGISSGTQNGNVTSTTQLQIHHQELEKLRRELLYRNSVNREASSRVSSQREALTTRKDEIARIDKRIAELTQRLHRKRVLNQQLTTQISAATQAKQAQLKAVQQKAIRDGKNDHSADGANIEDHRTLEDISQFDRGKHDPKYQTLPYNTKFSSGVKGGPGSGHRSNYENAGSENDSNGSSSDSNPSHQSASVINNTRNNGLVVSSSSSSASVIANNSASNCGNSNLGVITSTVHSIPAHLATKSHALAPCQTNQSGLPSAPVTQNFLARGQNSNAVGSMPSNQSGLSSSQLYHQKLQPDSCQPVSVSNSIQDNRANLPPTSLSVSFPQKINPTLALQQSRNTVVPSVHPTQNVINKDVENVRALGYPAAPPPPPLMTNPPPHMLGYHASNSSVASHQSSSSNIPASKPFQPGMVTSASSSGDLQDENSDQTNGKLKPILPPKPVVPSKPTPPPRQKGDPMASSTESINLIGVSNHRSSSSNRPQVFRYASQNVILSTYTQQQQLANQQQQISSLSREAQSNKTAPLPNQNNQSSEKQNQDPSKAKAIVIKEGTAVSESGDDYSGASEKVHVSINRRIEMPPDFLFPEDATPPSDLLGRQMDDLLTADRPDIRGRPSEQIDENRHTPAEDVHSIPFSADSKLRLNENGKEDSLENNAFDTTDRINVSNQINVNNNNNNNNIFNNGVNNLNVANNNIVAANKDMERLRIDEGEKGDMNNEFEKYTDEIVTEQQSAPSSNVVRRLKKGNLKTTNSSRVPRRVSFDPLALLLDASLEGELELVKRTATEVPNPSAANDEGITALHNAICAGHLDIVTFLVTFGCDVNAQDSDGWTPLHCAASCNNVAMVRFLVEHGACVLATTLSDHETAAEKCEQDEEGYDGCSQYLYSVQEKLGIMNGGGVYAVYEYDAQNDDELSFKCGDSLTVIRRGDEYERDWWWVRIGDKCGYVPRNLLGLYPRVKNPLKTS